MNFKDYRKSVIVSSEFGRGYAGILFEKHVKVGLLGKANAVADVLKAPVGLYQ